MRRPVLAVALSCAVACSPSDDPEREVEVSRRGDTTLVRIPEGADTAASVAPPAEILWQDPALGRPTSMALSGDRLFVADGVWLHVVTTSGTHVTSVGGSGQGPREFGRISAVGAVEDRVVALDVRNVRLALLDTAGAFLGTRRLAWPTPYVLPRRAGAQLRFWSAEVLWIADEFVRTDRRTRSALVASDLAGGDPRVVEEWDNRRWVEFGTVLFPAEAFPPEARLAVSGDGRVAWGDGMEYCVTMRPVSSPTSTRLCRDRPRAPVTAGVRRASVDGLDIDPRFSDSYAEAVEGQELGDFFPSLDRLEFGEDGRLWVRTVGRGAPDIHPTLLGLVPDRPPWPRRWEAYSRDGVPAGAVVLPHGFDPRIFVDREAYGFQELASGEITVARVSW